MADKWYFAKGERKLGPFSSAQLKELAARGQILPSDTVWKEGIEKGVVAAKVKHLFAVTPAAPAPAANVPSPSPLPAQDDQPVSAAMSEPRSLTAEVHTGIEQPIAEAKPHLTPPAPFPHPYPPLGSGEGKGGGRVGGEGVRSEPGVADDQGPSAAGVTPETPTPTEDQPAPARGSSPAAPAGQQKPESKKSPGQPAGTLQKSTRSLRVVGARGAVVLGQDGTFVRYRKKCPKCGTEDSSVRTLQLRSGTNRDRYFCQKCKKLQHVEIQAAL